MSPQASRRILFIRTGSPGDVLMTTPAVRVVREAFTHAHIAFLTGKGPAEVLANNPRIDEVISFDEKNLLKGKYLEFIKLTVSLRSKKFDTVIAFHTDRFMHFISYLTGASTRVAVSGHDGRYLTHRLDLAGRETMHPVDLFVELTGAIGIAVKLYPMELFITDKERKYASSFKDMHLRGLNPVIGLFPGGVKDQAAPSAHKRWDAERFGSLCSMIMRRYPGCGIVVFGSEDERVLSLKLSRLTGPPSVVDVIGRTTLRETVSLMGLLDLAVTNDSSPLHFAAALGIPVVSLSGLSAHRIHANNICMSSINPKTVFRACTGLLGPPA